MDQLVHNTRVRLIKKTLAWGLWAANLAIILWFWLPDGGAEVATGDVATMMHALGRLFGLLATFGALTQFILMGRVGWLEPIFGMDRLSIFHRRNGEATLILMLLHAGLMIISHPLLEGSTNYLQVFDEPYVPLALLGLLLFILTVGLSIQIAIKHLKFETWYTVHMLNYAAIAFVPWHQLTNGGDFLSNPLFANYWIGLYLFTLLNVLYFRFGMTLINYLRFGFRVEKVVAETDTATSVYITGRNLAGFHARGGQFILVRFFNKKMFLQEHPFSLSRLPNSNNLRLTIRQLGDFTNMVPQIKPGTPLWVSGPFGAFTHRQRRTKHILYIAGGIGITPIRSMIEEQALRGESKNAVLLYGNRTESDSIFLRELSDFAQKIAMPMHNVLSDQKKYAGEKGFIDKEKIARLVPDVTMRDIFLCGPPPMMWAIIGALKQLGVSPKQIHYERFSLHKD